MLQNCTKTSEAATTTMPQAEVVVVVVHNRPPDFPVIVLCYTDTAAVDAAAVGLLILVVDACEIEAIFAEIGTPTTDLG